jgi:hypothetical protein
VRWTSAIWGTAEFEEELRGFVVGAVGEPAKIERVKVRPWAAVWRVETPDGTYYAKQNCPGQAHEARLVSAMAMVAPGYVVPVTAADPGRDLLLTPDLGPTLQETGVTGDGDVWCRIVRDAAVLQRRLVPYADRLLLTILAPDDATTYVGDAIGRLGALPHDDPRRMPSRVADRLRALLPTVQRWSDQVADLDLPLTFVHNDLHSNNVVAVDGDHPLRFIDFGDAVLSDPLANLLIPLNVCADELGTRPDDARLLRIADAALEVWSDLAPMAELRGALPAALQLARLARVESWRRCVATMTAEERGAYGAAPAEWLGTLLREPPAGVLPAM